MNDEQGDILVGQVISQLGPRFRTERRTGACQIVTPFRYPDDTPITVGVSSLYRDRVVLTDHGEASDYAFVNGVGELTLRNQIRQVEQRFSIDTSGQELSIEVGLDELGHGLAALIGGIQDIGYLTYRQPSRRRGKRFQEEVERYLVAGEHPYERRVAVAGLTGSRTVAYRVEAAQGKRQLYLVTFEPAPTAATLSRAKVVAFDVRDISGAPRSEELRIAILVDDRNDRFATRFGHETRLILDTAGTEIIMWDERRRIEDLIAA